MPTSGSSFAASVWAILRKECRTEWRTRYGLNASLLFAISYTLLMYLIAYAMYRRRWFVRV